MKMNLSLSHSDKPVTHIAFDALLLTIDTTLPGFPRDGLSIEINSMADNISITTSAGSMPSCAPKSDAGSMPTTSFMPGDRADSAPKPGFTPGDSAPKPGFTPGDSAPKPGSPAATPGFIYDDDAIEDEDY